MKRNCQLRKMMAFQGAVSVILPEVYQNWMIPSLFRSEMIRYSLLSANDLIKHKQTKLNKDTDPRHMHHTVDGNQKSGKLTSWGKLVVVLINLPRFESNIQTVVGRTGYFPSTVCGFIHIYIYICIRYPSKRPPFQGHFHCLDIAEDFHWHLGLKSSVPLESPVAFV